MTRVHLAMVATLLVGVSACEKREFEPPPESQRIEAAEARYSPALFDTITWDDDDLRAHQGNEVFATRCRVCHGPLGRGGTEYALGQNLAVPSLIEAEWPLAVSIDSVRHRIYTGHEGGMPTWSIAGISPREIDAAAFYLLDLLRPEIIDN